MAQQTFEEKQLQIRETGVTKLYRCRREYLLIIPLDDL